MTDDQPTPVQTSKVAYIVTLAQDSKDPEAAETLVLVPAETRAKAHLVAQQQCRERQGWLRPRIIDSLRLPGEPAEATRLFTQIVASHLRPTTPSEGENEHA